MTEPAIIDVSAIIEGQKLNRFLVRLVVVSWIVTFFDGFDMNVIAFAAPLLAAEFHIDRIMMSNVFSIALVGTLIGGLVFGWLGDRIGRRPTIILATAAFGVVTLGFALARTYEHLLALRLLDGIAIGGMLPVCWALNIEYAPKRYRATIVTVIMIGYSLGITMAGPITVWLMPRFGWPAPFIFGGVLSLLAALVLIGTLPESVRFLISTGRRAEVIARIVRRIAPGRPLPAAAQFVITDESDQGKDFRLSLLFKGELRWITPLLWIGYIFSSMAVFFFATWTPSVFEAVGFSRTAAALGASVNSFAGAVGGLLLMRFTDIRGAIAITVMPLVALPLLLAVGFLDLGYWPFLVIQALAAVFLIGGHFGLHSIAGIFYPSAYRGSGTGWAFSVAKVGSIAGPLIAGRLLSTNLPVRNIFAVVAICPAVLFVCMLVIGTLHARLLRDARPPPSAGYAARKAGALTP